MARVNEGSHSFTCHPYIYPRMKWAILLLLPSRNTSPHFGRYSVPVPQRVGGWDGLVAGYIPRWYARSKKVTHSSTNRPIELKSHKSDAVTTRLQSGVRVVTLWRTSCQCRAVQTLYVPDKDYVRSEPSTPPSPHCSPSRRPNEENSTETEDKSDSTGMLNFTYPVSRSVDY